MNESHMIGHPKDATFEELNDALFQATLRGDEAQIATLQQNLRQQFSDLL